MWSRRLLFLSLCFVFALSSSVLQADDEKKKDAPEETVEVKLKDLVLNLPKSWAESDTVNSMRLATYEIPAADGDKDKGELAISTCGGDGGGVAANVDRWVGQFSPDGREASIKKGMAGKNAYHIADIAGTYQKPVGPPRDRKTVPAEGYRMLGVIITLEGKGVYFLKLTGPDATVKAQAEILRASFGAKSESEEDYEI